MPGNSVAISAGVSSSAATAALIDVEVYDSSNRRVFQQAWDNQSFSADQARSFSAAWPVPAGTTPGQYTIMIGVFKPGWSALQDWNGSAGSFSVNAAPAAASTPAPSFTTVASSSPASVARGATSSITTLARSATASKALIDVEVYNSAGVRMFQQYWDNQTFTAGETRSVQADWTVPASLPAGTYTIKVGVFESGWASVYNWNDAAGAITVS